MSIFGSSSKLLKNITVPEAKPMTFAEALGKLKIDYNMNVTLLLFGVTKDPLKLMAGV